MVFISLLFFSFIERAWCGLGNEFGSSATSAGMAGNTLTQPTNAFSAYENPAALSRADGHRLMVGWGLLTTFSHFKNMHGVVIQNTFTSTETSPLIGNVEPESKSVLSQVIGIRAVLVPEIWNLSLGIVNSIPILHLAHFDTGSAYIPEYALHKNRFQRSQLAVALSASPNARFHLGIGMDLSFSLAGKVESFLTKAANKTSTMQITSTIRPKPHPYLGFLWDFDSWDLGAVIRFEQKSPTELNVLTSSDAGLPISLDFRFDAKSSLYYEPWIFELGGGFHLNETTLLHLQVNYELWSQYSPPTLTLTDLPESTGITNSRNPSFSFRSIWVPHVGLETPWGSGMFRAGYAYRPSILRDPPNGNGNFLDPSRHILTVGYGWKFLRFLGLQVRNQLDLYLAYQLLQTQHIEKSAGNEVGDSADSKIGSPGYEAGGSIWGGGLAFQLMF